MNNAQELHYQFIKFGRIRLGLKNKMLAILPDLYESGIWKKYAGSIIEYCAKYGDIAPTTVMKRLKIEPVLKDKPYLRAAIETVGVHKVAMVAKLASPETDKEYAEKVLNMSKAATQTMSKEERAAKKSGRDSGGNERNMGLFGDDQKPQCRAVPTLKKIELDADASFLFMKLKAKFGKHLSDAKFIKLVLEATNVANEKTPKPKKSPVKCPTKNQKNKNQSPATSQPHKNALKSPEQTADVVTQTATYPTRLFIIPTATVRAKVTNQSFFSAKCITSLHTTTSSKTNNSALASGECRS